MSTMRTVIVTRGVVDVPDPSGIATQRAIERQSAMVGGITGISARTHKYSRRYQVGQTLVLPSEDAVHLAALGTVKIVS